MMMRKLTEEDCTQWYVDSLNDPEVNRYLETRHETQTVEKVKEFILSTDGLYGIFVGQQHIGNIKIAIDPHHRRGEISLWIGKEFWRKGYATKAIRKISEQAFADGLKKLTAGMYSQNHGSFKAFMNVGFRHEGTRFQYFELDGKRTDMLLVGMTEPEFNREPARNWPFT